MKTINYFRLISFLYLILSASYAAEEPRNDDPNLHETLKRIQDTCTSLPSRAHPQLPTNQDFDDLHLALFPNGRKIPTSLINYHLTLGNLVFEVDEIPSAHGGSHSELYHFIREVQNKRDWCGQKIPENWIPFAQDNGSYICIALDTSSVCYFSFAPHLKKEVPDYPTLSAWLQRRFLNH